MIHRPELHTLTPEGHGMAALREIVVSIMVTEDQHPATEPSHQMMPFNGDPVEDMEVAKTLIAQHPNVNLDRLIAIAADRSQPASARIAAIYTLGLTDDHGKSTATLMRLRHDPTEFPEVKDHAEEALGYIAEHC